MPESTSGEPKPDRPQIEIVTDEDWKERVKAEDAKLDAKTSQATSQDSRAHDIPAASFPMLVHIFSTQALVALGLVPSPDGKTLRELALARHFIDLLGVLEDKCRNNLTPEEGRLLENTLHELRMAYVEVSRAAPQEPSP